MTAPRAAEFGWPGGDVPGELSFPHEVSPELRQALLETLSQVLPLVSDSTVVRALTPPVGAIGRFSITTPASSWFVRVSARWGEPKLEQSITGSLEQAGLAVNHLRVAGAALDFAGERYRLDVRDLIAGRHFDGSREDLCALAALLAECHARLRTFPGAPAVRANAAERFAHLERVRAEMAAALSRLEWSYFSDDPAWASANSARLQELIDRFDPSFDHWPGAQCLHAQVHRANVLFRRADGQPVLVDWEEAVHTFAPVSWDLAYFIQRFCLYDDPGPAALKGRLAAVRLAYGTWVPGIAEMMRQTAWLSIVTIVAQRQSRGLFNPPAEYQKFLRLDHQARELASIIDGDLIAT